MKTPASGGINVQSITAPVEMKKASSRLYKLIRADGRPPRPGAEHAGGHTLTNTAQGSPVERGKRKEQLIPQIFHYFSARREPHQGPLARCGSCIGAQRVQYQHLRATPPPQLPRTRRTTVRSCLGRDPSQRPRVRHP